MTQAPRPELVVVGAGIAALELVLALRDLAGDRLQITLVAPEADFVLRPLLVAEPLGAAGQHRPSLREIADDLGIRFVQAAVSSVDHYQRRVLLRGGGVLGYQSLVLAPGVRRVPAFDDVIHIGDEAGARALEVLGQEIRAGDVREVVFVAPTLTGWLLPLYEAALITARIGAGTRVSLVTSEEEPLALFGPQASAAVAGALEAAGVAFVGGRQAAVEGGAVVLRGTPPTSIGADRVVSLPLIRGPRIPGVPETGLYGLIPVDDHARIADMPGAYAIGDATNFPIKQGQLACQQADAAAAHIAAAHGAPVQPAPFRPILGASLLIGDGTAITLGDHVAPSPGKVPGRYLAPYLASKRDVAAQA
jgi:sulfide:quinone oxidoreductase